MKKLVALLLAVMMLSVSVLALAEAPEYPAKVEGIDFGGRTVKIYTWYDMSRKPEPTEEEQAMYDYQDWIMETYNVKVEYEVPYDWAGSLQYMTDFVANADTTDLVIFTMPMDFIGPVVKNKLIAPLNNYIDVTEEKWNQGTVEFMTFDGETLGLWNGASEPRECIFFNVQALKDANIDIDADIYDKQANGEWTWDYFLELCAKVQKDNDGDGVVDVWATTGNGDDMIMGAIFNNGGSIYSYEDGKIVCNLGSENVLEALTFVRQIRDNYFRKAQTDAEGNTEQWDYYKQGFVQGDGVFRFGQTYEGFNGNEAMNTEGFEWGCVCFPTGPKAEAGSYMSVVNDNITCFPAIYTEEDLKLMGFLWDLWTDPTPGYEEDEEAWIGNKYDYTDDRAVEETYATLRDPAHTTRDAYIFLGDKNTVLGPDLFWAIDSADPQALIESVMPTFQTRADDFNK